MSKPLDHYYAKRDFSITPEPRGELAKARGALSYVIQKHAARRLHYDFRLELDGVLKSWAVPKGPSLDPADKRMAVETEDHPMEYGSFEGIIPAKQYGAGTVIVWDRGEWIPLDDPREGYRNGKLKFELRGEKLQGIWNLVRMRRREKESKETWLLIKEQDDAARAAASYSVVDELPDSMLSGRSVDNATHQPTGNNRRRKTPAATTAKSTAEEKNRSRGKNVAAKRTEPPPVALPAGATPAEQPLMLAPQLATLVDEVPHRGKWIYEVKYDGYRLLTRFQNGTPRLFTRNGNDWTSRLKGLAGRLKALPIQDGWLDGEIVVVGANGNPDFQALQNAFDNAATESIQYFLFDIPWYAGHDLTQVPLHQRRELLRSLLPKDEGAIHFSDDFAVEPERLLSTACELRLEGLIGKQRNAPYLSRRSPTWIKLKCTERQELVIGGFTEPKHAGRGVGALLLGFHEPDGSLRYAGKVGTGFTEASGRLLREKLAPLVSDQPPFDTKGERHRAKVHWVRPKLMAEVSFHEWTQGGHIRHAVYHGLRSDKPARVITQERAVPVSTVEKPTANSTRVRTQQSRRQKVEARTASNLVGKEVLRPRPDLGGVKLTHPDRVIDPSSSTTKQQLAEYYAAVTDQLLPQLADRPVSLVRAPQGVSGKHFFQKHKGTLKPPGIRELDPALMPDHDALITIDTRQGLLGAVQMNVIEFHTWNGVASRLEQPDRMLFDLDPGEGVSWQKIIEGTEATGIFLDEIGLQSFLKTSGGKGLHIVVPLQRRYAWDTVKDFSHAIVDHLASLMPERFVAKSGPRNRVGRIFIDYLRNGRGATTVAAFCVRARPGLGISMPVSWDQLHELTAGNQWHIGNTLTWLEQRTKDPWADYDNSAQALGKAMKKLGFKPAKQ